MRKMILLGLFAGLAACATTPADDTAAPAPTAPAATAEPAETAPAAPTGTAVATDGLRLGNGYRGNTDPCRRAGRTDFTAPHIVSDADLVACPVDFAGRGIF